MKKATVALLPALALILAIAPSMATSKEWQTVETWGDNLKVPSWQTVQTWTNSLNGLYVVGKPILISPDNNSTISDNTPSFQWIGGSNATYHHFLLDNDESFTSLIESVVFDGTTTTYTLTTPLVDDNYFWKVIAILGDLENVSYTYKFELISPITKNWQTVETWVTSLKTKEWQTVETWVTYLQTVGITDYLAKGVNYLHQGVAGIENDPPFELVWKKDILGTYDEFSGPIIVGGKIYIANKGDNIFRCLTLKSGTEIWSYQLNAATDGAPLWYGDRIYIGTGNSDSGSIATLYCFNADNGDLLWKYDGYNNNYFTSTPWVRVVDAFSMLEDFEDITDWDNSGSVILDNAWKTEGEYSVKIGAGGYITKDFNFGDIDNLTFDWTKNFNFTDDELRAYIGDNLVFRHYWGGDEWITTDLPLNLENYIGRQPLKFQVHGSTKYAWIDYLRASGTSIIYWVDGRYLYAFNPENGSLLWSDDLGAANHPIAGASYNGITYTPGKSGAAAIAAYNALTGNYLWGINYSVWDSGVTVDDSDPDNVLLFVGCRPMRVLCVDADDGTIYWNKLLDDGGIPANSYILTVPAVWENMVFVGGKKYYGYNPAFLCLDRENGDTIWGWGAGLTSASTTLYSSPTVLPSGKVIFITNQGVVRIHNAYTGATVWTYQLTEASYCGHIAVVEGAFSLASDRHLWVFGSGVGVEWQTVETWINSLIAEIPPPPPPPPPPAEFTWAVFVIRFLGIIGPLGFVAWKFSKIHDPTSGMWAAIYAGIGFVAIVMLWFAAEAIAAILAAI